MVAKKVDAVAQIIREAGPTGLTIGELSDVLRVSTRYIRRHEEEMLKKYPEIMAPPLRSKAKGYRWVPFDENGIQDYDRYEKELIISELKEAYPEGRILRDISEKTGVSLKETWRLLQDIGHEHVELNMPLHGSNRGYIWTPVLPEPKSEDIEIDPNNLDAIRRAFGQEVEEDKPVINDWNPDDAHMSGTESLKAVNDEIADLAAPVTLSDVYRELGLLTKINDESDTYIFPNPTNSNDDSGAVWSVGKSLTERFIIISKHNSHACGLFLRLENDGYPYPSNQFVWMDGGREWVANATRVCTVAVNKLGSRVGKLSTEELKELKSDVRSAIGLDDQNRSGIDALVEEISRRVADNVEVMLKARLRDQMRLVYKNIFMEEMK